jgi:hypothetical protein
MKRFPFFIFIFLLAACTPSPLPATATAISSEEVFQQTKLFALTAEVETQIAGYPKNDATVTAIMASKYAGGTSAAATMTAQPSQTPTPFIPADSPLCRPADLKTDFSSSVATQQVLLGASLTNISANGCFLPAWPRVNLVDQQGHPLDVTYGYFELGSPYASVATQMAQEPSAATARYGLLPGWTTYIGLDWQNWCKDPNSGGVVIQLTLLGNAGTIDIPTDIGAGGPCNAPGYGSSVGIAKLEQATPGQ